MPVNSQDIQNWFAANPGASADTIASTAAKYGVNASQIDSALGGHAAQDWVAAQDPSKLVSQYGTDFGYSSAPQTSQQFTAVPSYSASGNDYASTPGPMTPPAPGAGQRMSAAQVAGYDNGRNPDYWLTDQGMSNLTGLSMDARSAAGVVLLPDWWLKQHTDANKLATVSDPAAYLRQLSNQYYSTPESAAMTASSPENEAQWQDMLAKSRSIKDPNSGMYLTRTDNGNYYLLNDYGEGRGVYSTSAGADWSNTGVDQALFQQLAAGSGSAHQFKQVPQELIERYRETGNAFAGGPRSPDDVGRYRSPSQSSVDESLRQSLGNDYASTPGPMTPPAPGAGQRMSAAQVAGYDNGRNPDYWLTNQGMSNLTGLSMDARSAAGVSSLPDWWLKQNTDANKLATASDPAAYLRQLANQYYSTPESSAMAARSPESEAQWQDILAKSRSIKDPNSGMYLTRMPNGNYALLNEYGTGRGVYSTSAGADWSNTGVDQALFQQLAAGSGSAHQFKQVPQELIERYRKTGNAFANGPRSPDDVGTYRPPSQSTVDNSLSRALGTNDAAILNMARSMLGIQNGSAPAAGSQFQPVQAPANPASVFGGAGNVQPYSQNQWVNQYLPSINSWIQSHPGASWQDIYRYADSMGVPGLSARLAQLANSPTPDRRSGSAPYLHYGFGLEQLQYDNVNPLTQLVGSQKYAGGGAVAGNTPSATGALNLVRGGSGGQADDQLAWLSPGEYVMDADFVSALGDGNNAAGARQLDRMRENVRAHKRSAPANKIPPKAKTPERYLKGK